MSRIALFVSGNGTYLPCLIEEFDVAAIVCNNPDAPAMARTKGVPTLCHDHRDYPTREAWEEVTQNFLLKRQVDLIVLVGFMRILSPSFVRKWPLKIINTHPSLLPSFPGAHALQDALDYGAKVTGCTIHFVDEGVDTGPIITQQSIPIMGNDTVESLKERLYLPERINLISAVRYATQGEYTVVGRTVFFKGHLRVVL